MCYSHWADCASPDLLPPALLCSAGNALQPGNMGNLAMWVGKCVPPFSSHINLIGSVTNWSETDDTLWQPKMYWLTPNWCTLKSFLPQKIRIWIWIWCHDFLNVIFCSLVSAPGLMVVFSGQLGCKICPKLCNHQLPYKCPLLRSNNTSWTGFPAHLLLCCNTVKNRPAPKNKAKCSEFPGTGKVPAEHCKTRQWFVAMLSQMFSGVSCTEQSCFL